MLSQTTSFRNGCCSDSSAVIRFEGSSVSIRSNRSNASAGILKEEINKTSQLILSLRLKKPRKPYSAKYWRTRSMTGNTPQLLLFECSVVSSKDKAVFITQGLSLEVKGVIKCVFDPNGSNRKRRIPVSLM